MDDCSRKLKANWSIDPAQDLFRDIAASRRDLLRYVLNDLDADWGVRRSDKAMEAHLDYLTGVTVEQYVATDSDYEVIE